MVIQTNFFPIQKKTEKIKQKSMWKCHILDCITQNKSKCVEF